MIRSRSFPSAVFTKPLEWSFPAGISAYLLWLLWYRTPFELHRFTDRTIGTAVLQAYDVRARSVFVFEGLGITAIVCGLWLFALWAFVRYLKRMWRVDLGGRLRQHLRPAHYLALFSIAAMVFQVPAPDWRPASSIGLALAFYFLAAALWITACRALPSTIHAIGLACFSTSLGTFRLLHRSPYSPQFVFTTFAAIILFWSVDQVLRKMVRVTRHDRARLRSWLMVAMTPLLLLPAAPEIGQEAAYFFLLRFGTAPTFEFVNWMVATVLAVATVIILVAGVSLRPGFLRPSAWLFSRISIPLSLTALVVVWTMPRAGTAVNPDVHHWGEALMPLDQLLKFRSLPYVDLMPTHGLAENLGPLLHRVIYGIYSIDEFALGAMIATLIGYLSAYFFLRRIFASPALAALGPLMLPTVMEPSMGYAAPYYTVGLVVILFICRALRLWTTKAFFAAGVVVLVATLLRLDVGVGTALIGTALIAGYALCFWRDLRVRRALGFFAVLGGVGFVYLVALWIRTGGFARLAALRVFSSLDFQALYSAPPQFLNPLVSRYASNLFNALAFPASMVAVLMAIVAAGRLAVLMRARGLPQNPAREDTRFFWRASIVIAVGAYNLLVFNRGLQRFNESLAGGGFLTQYEIGFSFLVIILAAWMFGVRRGGLAMLWVIAALLTISGIPSKAMFAKFPVDLLITLERPDSPKPIRMNEFSARLYLVPELLSVWRNLRDYTPGQTFVELSNEPLFHVAFNRRFPAFNIITFTATGEAMQQAYLSGWKPEVVPVVLVRGGEGWLNDIDNVPDPVRNYRLYEQLYKSYQRDTQIGPYVMYRFRRPGPPAGDRRISSGGGRTVTPGAPLSIATEGMSIGPGQELTVSFQAQCHAAMPFRVTFDSAHKDVTQVAATACSPGYSTPEDWSDYKIQSPLGLSGSVSSVSIAPVGSALRCSEFRGIRWT